MRTPTRTDPGRVEDRESADRRRLRAEAAARARAANRARLGAVAAAAARAARLVRDGA